jgi:hypothetical protein
MFVQCTGVDCTGSCQEDEFPRIACDGNGGTVGARTIDRDWWGYIEWSNGNCTGEVKHVTLIRAGIENCRLGQYIRGGEARDSDVIFPAPQLPSLALTYYALPCDSVTNRMTMIEAYVPQVCNGGLQFDFTGDDLHVSVHDEDDCNKPVVLDFALTALEYNQCRPWEDTEGKITHYVSFVTRESAQANEFDYYQLIWGDGSSTVNAPGTETGGGGGGGGGATDPIPLQPASASTGGVTSVSTVTVLLGTSLAIIAWIAVTPAV